MSKGTVMALMAKRMRMRTSVFTFSVLICNEANIKEFL